MINEADDSKGRKNKHSKLFRPGMKQRTDTTFLDELGAMYGDRKNGLPADPFVISNTGKDKNGASANIIDCLSSMDRNCHLKKRRVDGNNSKSRSNPKVDKDNGRRKIDANGHKFKSDNGSMVIDPVLKNGDNLRAAGGKTASQKMRLALMQ